LILVLDEGEISVSCPDRFTPRLCFKYISSFYEGTDKSHTKSWKQEPL